MASGPCNDRWCRDFTARILPVEWKVAKHPKQKGFVEPLGVAALCFTEVATGGTFKFFDFTLVNCSKKEISISGLSDSGLQTTVSIFARAQNYDQLLVLLRSLQTQNDDLFSTERIPPAALATSSASISFLNHYLVMVATALNTRPSSSILGANRNRFLAVLRLLTRSGAGSSERANQNIALPNSEMGMKANSIPSQERNELEANERAMSLPFKIDSHRRLLAELGVNIHSNSEVTNIQKLQNGLSDVDYKETQAEIKKVYKPAYLLPKTVEDNQRTSCYTQRLEKIIRNAKSLCGAISNQDSNDKTAQEVVRSTTIPCGIMNLSDMSIAHSICHGPAEDRSPLDVSHTPGSAKFLKRPAMSVFNATVEDIPDLTTPL